MEEVFLALIEDNDINDPIRQRGVLPGSSGLCNARWIHDASKISEFMKMGWSVYRVNGFQRITSVAVEIKMEKKDDNECAQPTKPDNKRRR